MLSLDVGEPLVIAIPANQLGSVGVSSVLRVIVKLARSRSLRRKTPGRIAPYGGTPNRGYSACYASRMSSSPRPKPTSGTEEMREMRELSIEGGPMRVAHGFHPRDGVAVALKAELCADGRLT